MTDLEKKIAEAVWRQNGYSGPLDATAFRYLSFSGETIIAAITPLIQEAEDRADEVQDAIRADEYRTQD